MKVVNTKEWHVSDSVKRLNPHLFLEIPDTERKQGSRQTLGSKPKRQEGPKYRVYIVSHRHRLMRDSDNLSAGAKALRDKVAQFLGLDDRDLVQPNFEWIYQQQPCKKGDEGTMIRIKTL